MQATADQRDHFWRRLETSLLLILLGLALWPVWGNAFFLTNDGPCHLYNARILRDMLLGNDAAFYGEWFALNPEIEPNWLNHFLLALFQVVLPPIVSEKLFLTLYLVGFGWAFRYLARSVFPANGFWVFLALPFAFHKVFLYGFFNFSASVVLLFLLLGFWLRHRADAGWRRNLILGLLMLLLLMTHPVSYTMGMGLIALQWLGETAGAATGTDRQTALRQQARSALRAALAALPSLGLFVAFLLRQGMASVPSTMKLHKLFHDLLELRALVLFQDAERPWPIALAVFIGLLVVVAIARNARRQIVYSGLLLMLVLSIYAYFNQPAQVGGVGIVAERLQFFPFLIALSWLATLPWPRWMHKAVILAGFAVTATLFAVRLPSYALTSEAVTEFVSAQAYMKPYTTAVMLDYAPEGRYPHDGPSLSKEAFLFMHVTEYIGARQPHIILNNYEADTKWFPLRWQPLRNPYTHLVDGPGFEGWLPTADFEKFRNETGRDVDYVLLWCLTQELRQYEGVQLMLGRLERDYMEIYVSDGTRMRLWQRKR